MDRLKPKLDKTVSGLIAGLIGPWFGLFIFYLIFFNDRPFAAFFRMIQIQSEAHSGIIAVSLVFNLVFFFSALQLDWYRAARGVIMSMFIYAPLVVYLKYAA